MESLFLAVAALACPVGMGLMMWMMMRGQGKDASRTGSPARVQVDQLRAEIDQLKAERAANRGHGGQ